MTIQPQISVLTTCCNREKYLAECIQSVLNSHFEDFELIIVDDQSTDRSLEIAKLRFKDTHSCLSKRKILAITPTKTRNASYATGKYLKYVDDDLIYPWGLQILWDCMEQFPEARWGLCSLESDKQQPFPFQLNSEEAYRYHYLGPGLFHKSPLSSIIRRDLFEEVGGFRPGRMVGDFEMWHRTTAFQCGSYEPRSNMVPLPRRPRIQCHDEFRQAYNGVRNEYLNHPDCPLNQKEIKQLGSNGCGKTKVALMSFAKSHSMTRERNDTQSLRHKLFFLVKNPAFLLIAPISRLPYFRFLRETSANPHPITFGIWFFQKVLGFNRHAYWPMHFTSNVVGVQNIQIGVGTYPGYNPGVYIQGTGTLKIGNYTHVGQNAGILSGGHNIYNHLELTKEQTEIGDYCWIGMNSVILPEYTWDTIPLLQQEQS